VWLNGLADYQLPLDGQAPVLAIVQVRVGPAPLLFAIVNTLADFDVDVTV
jgi:hypothetical protein